MAHSSLPLLHSGDSLLSSALPGDGRQATPASVGEAPSGVAPGAGISFSHALLNTLQQIAAAIPKTAAATTAAQKLPADGRPVETEAADERLQQLLDSLLASGALPVMPLPPLPAALRQEAGGIGQQATAAPLLSASGEANSAKPASALPQITPPVVSLKQELPLPAEFKGMAPASPVPSALNAVGAAGAAALATPALAVAEVSASSGDAPLRLEGGDARLAQQLQAALGERLQIQVKNQIQHATIRLDPPDMGKIDISLQIENGRMQVTINASSGEVYRALSQLSNDLRQSLTEQNLMQVSVQVSSRDGQQQSSHQRQTQRQPEGEILAAADIEAQSHERREDGSVLLTV